MDKDKYFTPSEGVLPLLPFLKEGTRYCEPMAGNGSLIRHLRTHGHVCKAAYDIEPEHKAIKQLDAFKLTDAHLRGADVIITNPPWNKKQLHQAVQFFPTLRPTWLLFYADWAYTVQSAPFMPFCTDIVAVGRLKWIPGSEFTGKENCAWYRFEAGHTEGPRFHGRTKKQK